MKPWVIAIIIVTGLFIFARPLVGRLIDLLDLWQLVAVVALIVGAVMYTALTTHYSNATIGATRPMPEKSVISNGYTTRYCIFNRR